jgi:hypothetical protein
MVYIVRVMRVCPSLVCACNEVVESHSTMHPRAKVALWCIASFVSLLLAAPWHAGLSDIARSDCVGGPIYDPMSNIVRLSPFDTEHMSRHARALVTALFLWAAAAHVRDGRTAKTGWALGPLLLLQPVAWVGDSACASREVPLDNGAMFVLYPLSLYDIRGLSFVLDAPTTVGVWACLCLRTLASEEDRLVRNGTAIFVCILLMVYGSVVRRAGMPAHVQLHARAPVGGTGRHARSVCARASARCVGSAPRRRSV